MLGQVAERRVRPDCLWNTLTERTGSYIMDRSEALTLTERELFDRLGWFTHIRWGIGALCLLILLVSRYALGVRFRVGPEPISMAPAVAVVVLIFAYNAVFTFLVHLARVRWRITRRLIVLMALGQILLDMLAVFALVHFTGGVENFFIILMILPLVIATELMPQKLAYATALGAAVLVNALAWGEQRGLISHVSAEWGRPSAIRGASLYADHLYVLEVTVALTVAMFAMVFIASAIAGRLRRREAELEGAYRLLRVADEAKSFFMRKAGHELRAPLSAIYSMLEAIRHTIAGLPDDHDRLLARAQDRTRALMTLVDDLRRYSRLRTAAGAVPLRPVRFGEVVRNTVELLNPRAHSAGVTLSCAAEDVTVEGDEELLGELVTNLVANAVQYTPSGGRIEVALAMQGGCAVLTVADTGIGISQAARQRLFEEFYRASEARKIFPDGTGLGLAICRRIVQMHRGRIEAASRPEGGSVFTVSLPAMRGAMPAQVVGRQS